jgi:hypothetical protein
LADLCACRFSSCLRVCAGLLSGFGPRLLAGWPSVHPSAFHRLRLCDICLPRVIFFSTPPKGFMKFMPIMPGLFRSFGDELAFLLCADVPILELSLAKVASCPKAADRCCPAGDSPSGLDASSADSSREEAGASDVSSSSKLMLASAVKSISSAIPLSGTEEMGQRGGNNQTEQISAED